MSADAANLGQLEGRIDRLLAACRSLAEQNQTLQQQQQRLLKERALLLKRQQEARTRLEALVSHLKMLEAGN